MLNGRTGKRVDEATARLQDAVPDAGVSGLAAEQEGLTKAEMEEQFFAEARPSSLLQRFAEPDEVAALITYVCSDLASATDGASLRVDGGVVRSAF